MLVAGVPGAKRGPFFYDKAPMVPDSQGET